MPIDDHLLTRGQLDRLRRERRLATTAGVAGALVSGAANLIASDGGPIGWAVAAVAPAAFVLSAELAATGSLGTTVERARSTVAAAIALAAAVVSFGHLREVVLEVGESGLASVLIPLVVDAVVLMGLVTHRTTGTQLQRHEAAAAVRRMSNSEGAAEPSGSAAVSIGSPTSRNGTPSDRSGSTNGQHARSAEGKSHWSKSANARSAALASSHSVTSTVPRPGPAETRALRDQRPEMTHAELAAELGISTKTVQRHLKATEETNA